VSAQDDKRYRRALLDWLACAARGSREPAARAARTAGDGLLERVTAAGAAGHVLDFDDTWLPGLAHLSAPTAPAALVLAAELGRPLGEALEAYAAGFEAMAAVAAASHPALYEHGWHPTAVCGTVGAAVSAARLLGLDAGATDRAAALAVLRAGGLRAAFGSDGKSLQVGMAASAGVHAARLVAAGAAVPADLPTAPAGFEQAFGGRWAEPGPGEPAVRTNWIKAYPCCLQAHSAIEAAERLDGAGALREGATVVVHPLSRQAAAVDDPQDPLQAKFSIPYLVAYTTLNGPPNVESFMTVDAAARELALDRIAVRTDPGLLESEARIVRDSSGDAPAELARVAAARGSPERPLDDAELAAKVRLLAGERLETALDDGSAPAAACLEAAGLR
jgi:2-methylcitrate dehydratase PrpD